MQFDRLGLLVGLTSAAIVSAVVMPAPAFATAFQIESGVTSVFLDTDLLKQAAGLELTGVSDDVAAPVSDQFLVGFNITPETNFSFSDENGFTLLGGSIEHVGTVTFNGNTTVGNFSIGFDAARVGGDATGFFVKDTVTTNAVLFDVANVSPALDGDRVTISGDLLVSKEFAAVLGNAQLQGAAVGRAQTNAIVSEKDTASVPEPTVLLGLIAAGAGMTVTRRSASNGKA